MRFIELGDALVVEFAPASEYDHSHPLGEDRVIHYSADNHPIGVKFLRVSRGINLDGIPHREQIAKRLPHHIKELV